MRFPTSSSLCITIAMTIVATAMPTKRVTGPDEDTLKKLKLAYNPAPESNGRGIGMLVVPGGGYENVDLTREGTNSTAWLNERGYDSWVLNYSTASTAPTPLYPVPQDQALAAVQYIRSLDMYDKLGLWGYSAGGHLAAVTLNNESAEIDFGILTYPVITMEEGVTHPGSRSRLQGQTPTEELVERMSAEKHVKKGVTPPTFVYHSANDASVPVENALRYVRALSEEGIAFQVSILPNASHGINLGLDNPVHNWTPELDRWLKYSV
jgi:acetyl esterase/lipase